MTQQVSSDDIRELIIKICTLQEHFDPNSDYPADKKIIKISPEERARIVCYLSILLLACK